MAQFAFYPPSSSGGSSSNPSVSTNGTTAPASSTLVAGQNPSGNLQPLQTDGSGDLLTKTNGSPGVANAPVYNSYSSTNITTTAYTQLIASTTAATNTIDIFDSSGQAMILATGPAGSEVILYYVPPGGDTMSLKIPAGTRVAYKALTANATSGYLLLNLLQ